MAGRGPQTFKKRQKEQKRKDRQAEKLARRLHRKQESRSEEAQVNDFRTAGAAVETPWIQPQ